MESCHLEFLRVTPLLEHDYECILIDLPGHTGSRAIPFSMENAINGISHIIKNETANGKAHIVGLSMGGYIALELARRSPDLILSIFCTGCEPPSGFRHWAIAQPRLLSSAIIGFGSLAVTESIFWWSFGVQPIPGLFREVRQNRCMKTLKAGFVALNECTLEKIGEIKDVRIAIVAGGKLDSVKDTRAAGQMLATANPACKAFVVRDAIHWWDLQYPELFAHGIRAWIEKTEMLTLYEPLL